MRALYLPGGRNVELSEIDKPRPGPGEVLIALRAAGLCGSDLHMQYRPAPSERNGVVFGLVTNPDVVPGHEPAGVVAQTGEGVTHLDVGERVAVHHMGGCGHCMNCRRGWDINCQQKWGTYGLDRPGAMQDFMVVRSQDCVVVPPNISLAEAAYYTCGAGTGYLALKRGAFGLGDTVAIIGLGPVGLAGGFFASLTGARVIGIDTIESRCTFAHQKGISIVCNPRTDDAVSTVLGATGGQGADVVLETSGSAAGRILALDVAAIHGRVVCVGFADTSTVLDVQRQIIQKQLDVRGAWMFPLPELQRMLDDVSRQQISIQSLITDTYRIEDGAEAWSAFDQGSLGKTLITWTD